MDLLNGTFDPAASYAYSGTRRAGLLIRLGNACYRLDQAVYERRRAAWGALWAGGRAVRRKRNYTRHLLHSRVASLHLSLQRLLTLVNIVSRPDDV